MWCHQECIKDRSPRISPWCHLIKSRQILICSLFCSPCVFCLSVIWVWICDYLNTWEPWELCDCLSVPNKGCSFCYWTAREALHREGIKYFTENLTEFYKGLSHWLQLTWSLSINIQKLLPVFMVDSHFIRLLSVYLLFPTSASPQLYITPVAEDLMPSDLLLYQAHAHGAQTYTQEKHSYTLARSWKSTHYVILCYYSYTLA